LVAFTALTSSSERELLKSQYCDVNHIVFYVTVVLMVRKGDKAK